MKKWILLSALTVCFILPRAYAQTQNPPINIAVASNFVVPLESIIKAYQKTSNQKINLLAGSTGTHYAQIIHGAPIDLFFAADQTRPNRLFQDHKATDVFTYAIGQLVYFIPQYQGPEQSFEDMINQAQKRISIANPELAPYGLAAQQTLKKLNKWDHLKYPPIRSENIGRCLQTIQSGAVDAGFVAYSQVLQLKADPKTYWIVPSHYHDPIKQDVAIIHHSPAVEEFMQYFKSKPAQDIILQYGYQTPLHPLNQP